MDNIWLFYSELVPIRNTDCTSFQTSGVVRGTQNSTRSGKTTSVLRNSQPKFAWYATVPLILRPQTHGPLLFLAHMGDNSMNSRLNNSCCILLWGCTTWLSLLCPWASCQTLGAGACLAVSESCRRARESITTVGDGIWWINTPASYFAAGQFQEVVASLSPILLLFPS